MADDPLPQQNEAELKLDMTLECSVDEEGSADLLQDLMTDLMEWKRNGNRVLQPAVVYSDCPYASEVEFGTGPNMRGHGTEDEQMAKMELWVEKRLNEQDGGRKHKLAVAFRNKIDKEGIAPSPYMRSSLALVLRDRCPEGENATSYFDEGGSIPDLADEIKERIKGTLRLNQMEITHALIDSIKAEPLPSWTVVGGEVKVEETAADDSVTEEMWQDKSLGRHNKRPTRYWRYPS